MVQKCDRDRLVPDLVREDVDRREARRREGTPQQVCDAELGHDARMRGQAHAAHRRQAHGHAVPTPAFVRVEVQPGIWEEERFEICLWSHFSVFYGT